MRSRAARRTFGVVAWIALGAAAFFFIHSERRIAERRAAVRAFDLQAREATNLLSNLRAAQQAYVAAGQGAALWMPRVAVFMDAAASNVDGLRPAAGSDAARRSLMEAAATVTEFDNVDKRARDYLRSDQQLMAADVVFTEGGATAASAARHVEAARLAEYQALDASETAQRRLQAFALAGAGAFAAILIALMAFAPAPSSAGTAAASLGVGEVTDAPPSRGELLLGDLRRPSREASLTDASIERPRGSVPALKAAALLCTEFSRVNHLDALTNLLGRAADLMDASGLVVWIGSAEGADLRPVLAHGYSAQTLVRMPAVPCSASNAVAAAYRAGALQIVSARPGASSGAIAAPLLAPEGCIGALTAEIKDGGETSDSVQALATIFAAQLAGVLVASAAPVAEQRAATS
jgi:hypothetical protein